MPRIRTMTDAVGSWLIAGVCTVLASCATTSTTTRQYVGVAQYPPSNAAAVQVVRAEPSRPHDRLGEIVVDASLDPAPPPNEVEDKLKSKAAQLGADAVVVVLDRVQPTASYIAGPYWGRTIDSVQGRKVVGVAIKYR
jgi:hypothetical protein